eukprot:sb/3473632/
MLLYSIYTQTYTQQSSNESKWLPYTCTQYDISNKHTHTQTQTLTHTLTHTHIQTHTQTLSPSLFLDLLLTHLSLSFSLSLSLHLPLSLYVVQSLNKLFNITLYTKGINIMYALQVCMRVDVYNSITILYRAHCNYRNFSILQITVISL